MDPLTAECRAAGRLLTLKETLAGSVTDALYAERSDLLERYGPVGRDRCLEDVRYTIDHLIPAVDLAEPPMFATYVRWLDDLLGARHVPRREVTRSLELIDEHARSHLAPDEADAVTSCIRAGLESLGSEVAQP